MSPISDFFSEIKVAKSSDIARNMLLSMGITTYRNGPKRIGTDRNGPERTETDRNGPKRTFVDTETDFLGTETDFSEYRN